MTEQAATRPIAADECIAADKVDVTARLMILTSLVFLPIGVAAAYYFIPKSVDTPLYSHTLSIFGFWIIAFVYVWTGTHHLIFGPAPHWLQTVSILFSFSLVVPVAIIPFFLSLMVGGFLQGLSWMNTSISWVESIAVVRPYWLIRLASGTVLLLGQFVLLFNLAMTILPPRQAAVENGEPEDGKPRDGKPALPVGAVEA